MKRYAAVFVSLLALAACGDGASTTTTAATTTPPTTVSPATTLPDTTTRPATTAPTTAPPTTTAPTTAPPSTAAPDPGRITVMYTDGTLDGGLQQVQIDAGTEVTLVVETDVTDEVHVHGYDLYFDVSPGITEFSFVADIPGIFEAELERIREPIVKLEVR